MKIIFTVYLFLSLSFASLFACPMLAGKYKNCDSNPKISIYLILFTGIEQKLIDNVDNFDVAIDTQEGPISYHVKADGKESISVGSDIFGEEVATKIKTSCVDDTLIIESEIYQYGVTKEINKFSLDFNKNLNIETNAVSDNIIVKSTCIREN